ncbi:hypothetical protein [Aliarcobacter butzleri]|uniref:hypothetical protein n=1 Tax=Aliarcobacter butzleri TaxID=28197 RepID=UPI003AF4FCDA
MKQKNYIKEDITIKIRAFKIAIKRAKIDLTFFCFISKLNIDELNSYLNKDENEDIPDFYTQALANYLNNKEQMEEKEFLHKAKQLGFNIIKDDNIDKIEINLQKPISLSEDFELPSKFNHLVYYTIK